MQIIRSMEQNISLIKNSLYKIDELTACLVKDEAWMGFAQVFMAALTMPFKHRLQLMEGHPDWIENSDSAFMKIVKNFSVNPLSCNPWLSTTNTTQPRGLAT